MAGALQDDLFIGRRAQEYRGLLKIKYPMEHGIVTDWDDMERIWGWVYGEGLKALSEEVSHFRHISRLSWWIASCIIDGGTSESEAE
jgi:actin-related protein